MLHSRGSPVSTSSAARTIRQRSHYTRRPVTRPTRSRRVLAKATAFGLSQILPDHAVAAPSFDQHGTKAVLP